MKVPLLKASFMGQKNALKSIIETLKATGSFEMTVFKRAQNDIPESERENYDDLLALQKRLKHALAFAKVKDNLAKTALSYDGLKTYAQYQQDAIAIVRDLEHVQTATTQIKSTITQNKETIKQLKAYWNLPVAFSDLQSTRGAHILCGIMSTTNLQRFLGDFDLSKMSIESFPSGKNDKCVVLTCHRSDAKIADVIHDFGFEPCPFSFSKNAQETTQILVAENTALEANHDFELTRLALSIEEARTLKNFFDYVTNEIDTADLAAKTLQTERHYVLTGWIVASEEESIRRRITAVQPDVIISFTEATELDQAPSLIKNSRIVAPFQTVTNMYGAPASRDIDPNPFVAFFFFMFFGMMLGDVGYAVVLMLACAAFIYLKKPFGGTRQFILLFALGGISALIWGLLYGSIFGFKIPSQVINPVEGAIYLLLLSLALGLLQLLVGTLLNFYKHVLNKDYWDAMLDSLPRIVLFIGLFMFLPTLAFGLFNVNYSSAFLDAIKTPGMYITIAGAVVMIIFNGRKKRGIIGKVMGSLAGAYGLVNYFNDVISYVRLFALALVGAVICGIANTMGGMMFGIPVIGYPLGIVVAIAFHTFNLGLALLGAYIHGARLHFIEFFSKFYSGEGKAFTPIGTGLRYSQITKKGGK